MSLPLGGTLALIGAGKMGGALLEGWLRQGIDPARVVAFDPHPPPEMAAVLKDRKIRHNPDPNTLERPEVVLVAVKPQFMDEALAQAKPLAQHRPLVISVAAGKTIATFEQWCGKDAPVVRAMPNTPAAVGRGITAMVANAHVDAGQRALALALLAAVGEVVTLDDEALLDAVTAVSGSGPAYVFYLTECLAAAGRTAGLDEALAVQLARATVAGAGELMRQSGLAAEVLRQNVTSPKGTTQAALAVLMADDGLEPLMRRAVEAAQRRSKELGKG
jgi:pyrroline-5-carboxylate reductase